MSVDMCNSNIIPSVVLICGLPGTGKSSIASMLHDFLGWSVVSTEVMRSRLFDYTVDKHDIDFSDDELCIVYKIVCIMTEFLVRKKLSVIVEGVFRSKKQRNSILNISENLGAIVVKVFLTGSDMEIMHRLKVRLEAGNIAPAGPRTFRSIKKRFEPVESDYLIYDTTKTMLEEVAESIVSEIRRG